MDHNPPPTKKSSESDQHQRFPKASPSADSQFVVKIDCDKDEHGSGRLSRSPSCEFWKDSGGDAGGGGGGGNTHEGSPNLMDLNSDSPVRGVINSECANSDHRVLDSNLSFENNDLADSKLPKGSSEEEDELGAQVQQRHRRNSSELSSVHDNEHAGEVLKCTSFQRRPTLLRTKTQQSRLMDPPEVPYSGPIPKSGRYTPGMTGYLPNEIDDEEDSLFDELDNPDDLKHSKLDALTILQWISLVLMMTALIFTFRIRRWKELTFRGLLLWQWEVLVLVLICGRLLSFFVVRLVVFLIERNFLLRKRLLYFVYGVRDAVQNCIWLTLVVIAWNWMFDKTIEDLHIELLEVINKILLCMLVASWIWLVKTLIVKVLASTFHVNKFFDRIQDALFNQYVIETLSGPPLIEIHNNQLEDSRMVLKPDGMATDIGGYSFKGKSSRRVIGSARQPARVVSGRHVGGSRRCGKDQAITIDHLHRLNPDNVSAWNMKRLMKVIRHGSLTTLDEHLYNDESGTEIRSEIEAKRAARKIFMNVTRRRSKFIYLDDLMRFLRDDEAIKTMSLIVGSPDVEKISKAALKNWVVNVFRERKALALTLNDTKTAVNKLHRMVKVLVGIIIFIICLVIINIATTKVILLIISNVVLVAFVFGNTCKNIFESIIFLFVMHPFDVGDRCEIDGVQLIVEEMNILNTIFLRADNQKVYYPNSVLITRAIGNFYRSPDMADTIDFLIHVGTPAEKIAIIKQRIINYVLNNKDYWYNDVVVFTKDMNDLNTQKLSVWVTHTINYQDITERMMRRSTIIDEMNRIFKELDIEYRNYPLDINVRSMPLLPTTTRVPSTWGAPN